LKSFTNVGKTMKGSSLFRMEGTLAVNFPITMPSHLLNMETTPSSLLAAAGAGAAGLASSPRGDMIKMLGIAPLLIGDLIVSLPGDPTVPEGEILATEEDVAGEVDDADRSDLMSIDPGEGGGRGL
jgi:hypothetical protein